MESVKGVSGIDIIDRDMGVGGGGVYCQRSAEPLSIGIKAWINKYIHVKSWDVINNPRDV